MAFDVAKLKKLTPEQLKAIDLTVEDVAEAEKGFLQEADYTKKLQEVSALKRIRDANPELNFEEALTELNSWRTWRQNDYPGIETKLRAYEEEHGELERLRGATPSDKGNGGRKRGNRRFTTITKPDDLWDASRLFEAFNEIADVSVEEAAAAGLTATKNWWEKEQGPVIQQLANDYMASVIGPVRAMWDRIMVDDKGQPLLALTDVYKEMQATGERNFMKAYDGLTKTRTASRQRTFEEGIEEGKKLATEAGKNGTNGVTSPPGPSGRPSPSWTPPPATSKLNREQRRDEVLRQVEKRRGPLPA